MNDFAKTWAVIVGIDQYANDAALTLQHQVEHACRFARWLLRRGVPAEQIFLHLAPLPALNDLAVNVREASINAIFETLDTALRDKQGLLCLYWGGHGVIARDQRCLLGADATSDNIRSLNLDNLLFALRTEYFQFAQQAVIVDSCASHLPEADSDAARRFDRNHQLASGRRQFVLYSAAETQAATDGIFSALVLDWLERHPACLWPTDLEQLAEAVKASFRQLRAEGKTYQTPVYFTCKSWDGEEEKWFGDFATLRLLRAAREHLREVPVAERVWRNCYWRTTGETGKQLVSLAQTLGDLAQPVPGDRLELLLEFAWRIAEQCALPKIKEKIKEWVTETVDYQTKLENLKNQLSDEQPRQAHAYLLIEVLEGTQAATARAEQQGARWLELLCWLHNGTLHNLGSRLCPETGLNEEICALLLELENGGHPQYCRENLLLELFVPARLLVCAADQHVYVTSPLGAEYPLALRWHERLAARSPIARPMVWRRVAERLHTVLALKNEHTNFWAPDDEDNPQRLAVYCGGEEFRHSFLGFSLPVFAHTVNDVSDLLKAALSGGTPYAFWPRDDVGAAFKKEFDNLVRTLPRWELLPEEVRKLRYQALGKIGHPGATAVLLWDDPRRVPPRTST